MKIRQCFLALIFVPLIATCLLSCDQVRDIHLPVLPVEVKQRNALLAGGKVACFKNTGQKTLSVLVKFENSSFGERKIYKLVLSPGEKEEIGGFEGWRVIPGETVSLNLR